MANAPEIRQKLGELLSHKIALEDFEEWFAPYSWNIHQNGDLESQQMAYAIENQLAQFDEDCEALRVELTRIHGAATGHNLGAGDPGSFLVAGSYGGREISHVELRDAA